MRNSSQKIHQLLLKHDFEMVPNKTCNLINHQDEFHVSLDFYWWIYFEENLGSYFGHFVFQECDSGSFKIIDGNHRFVLYIMALSISLECHKPSKELKELHDKIKDTYFQFCEQKDPEDSLRVNKILSPWCWQLDSIYLWMKQRISKDYKKLIDLIAFQNELLEFNITFFVHKDQFEADESLIKSNIQIAPPTIYDYMVNQLHLKSHLATMRSTDRRTEGWFREYLSDIQKVTALGRGIEKYVSLEAIVKYALKVKFNDLNYSIDLNSLNDRFLIGKAYRSFEYIKPFVKYTYDIFTRYEPMLPEIKQLLNLGHFDLYFPFILKAIHFDLPEAQIIKLCQKLNTLVFRFLIADQPMAVFEELNTAFKFFKTKDDADIVIASIISIIKREDSSYTLSRDNLYRHLFFGLKDEELKYLLWRFELEMTADSKVEKGITFKEIKSMITHPIQDVPMDELSEFTSRNDYTNPYSYKDIGNTFLTESEDSLYKSAKSLIQNDFLENILGKDQCEINQILHHRKMKLIRFALDNI